MRKLSDFRIIEIAGTDADYLDFFGDILGNTVSCG